MATSITRLPEEWKNLYAAGRWPCWSFNVVDRNGVSITDFDCRVEVRKAVGMPVIKTLTTTAGLVKSGNNITFDTVVDLAAGVYLLDIKVVLGNGRVYYIKKDFVTVEPNITA